MSTCPGFNPDESDLTLTGEAGTDFEHTQGLLFVGSASEIFATKEDAVKSWTRSDKPATARCMGYFFKQGQTTKTTKVTIVSAGRMAFPKLAPRTTAFKVVARLAITNEGKTTTVPITLQLVAFGQGRGDTSMFAITPGTGIPTAELRALGKLLAAAWRPPSSKPAPTRLLASAHPSPRPPQDRAEFPAPLRRDVRVGCRNVSGCDRAHGRRLRPDGVGSVGQRAPDRGLPADHRDRLPLRTARRPALPQAAADRVRSRPRRDLLRAAVRRQRDGDRGPRRRSPASRPDSSGPRSMPACRTSSTTKTCRMRPRCCRRATT